MSGIRYGLIFLLCISMQMNCQEQEKDIKKEIADEYKSFTLLYYQKGNFTNEGSDDYIVFYEDPSRRIEKNKPPHLSKVCIFSFSGIKIQKKYELDYFSLGFNERALRIITHLKLGQTAIWNGYCYIGDFNKNSRDEIILFGLGGS